MTRRPLLALLLAGVLFSASGCAAMVRSWYFQAVSVADTRVRVEIQRAEVGQRVAQVALLITNLSPKPLHVSLDTLNMTLPDGTPVPGKMNVRLRATKAALGTLADWGLMDHREDPSVAPGEAVMIKVAFRQHLRDLRRHPALTIDLAGLQIEGAPAHLPPLVLTAPPDAPLGEDV